MKKLLQCAAFACVAFLAACNSPQSAEQIAGSATNKTEEQKKAEATRAAAAVAKKAVASAYYYKTLAVFKGGKEMNDLNIVTELTNTKEIGRAHV